MHLFPETTRGANRSRVLDRLVGRCRPLIARPRRWVGGLALAWAALGPGVLAAQALPASVTSALKKAGIPADALSVVVASSDAAQPPRLRQGADRPVNPASVMKLVTTYAALDLLGPSFTWRTPFYVDGTVHQGLLRGNLYIQGGGDPKWVMERITESLQTVHAQGVTVVVGDIVLDQGAFQLPRTDPAAFDGERLRPYNASPEALLVNFKSLVLGFVPDVPAGVARVSVEPPLEGVLVDRIVPLSSSACGDWRGALQALMDNPARVQFMGSFPARCGERTWPVAYADPDTFAERAIEGLWRASGGLITGQVRRGTVPATARPIHEAASLPLSNIVSDVNKFSNNIMAQQVFLTLGRLTGSPGAQAPALRASAAPGAPVLSGVGTFERSRERLASWWQARLGSRVPVPVIENGSGLSREERITADALLALLRDAARHPNGRVLFDSLPVAGVDGTAVRMGERGILKNALGNARIKTGSLRDVAAIAGYVNGLDDSPWVVAAIVNHPNAAQARPALDALLEWAATLRR